jgi:hypothetical protein
MQAHIARGGRRRRVLHEEARTAAGLHATTRMSMNDGAQAPRYGELAGVEHHPQVTDFVPRRKRAVLLTLAGGAAIAAASEALVHGSDAIAGAVPGISTAQVAGQLAGGLTAWTSAVAMLAIAGLARLIYSLRRHRVDDVRGRYCVWKHVSWAALALSVNAVVGLHAILRSIAIAATGWTLTSTGAEWWLIPLAVVGGWIAVRLVREAAEAPSVLAMALAATACWGAAAAGALGWTPAWLGAWGDALTSAVPLAGHVMALAGMMLFARYVVLDVQELIEHKPRAAKPAKVAKVKAEKAPAVAAVAAKAAAASTAAAKGKPAPAVAETWSAEEDEEDAEDEESTGMYLSKSERKRLRKQQQQRRAA